MSSTSHIEIYQSDDGETPIEVRLEQETLWLSRAQTAELFERDSDTIGLHLKNIFSEGELDETSTTEESSVVRKARQIILVAICYQGLAQRVATEV